MKSTLQPKKGALWTYATLLACILAFMMFIAKCSSKPLSVFGVDYAKSLGDTIDIGIELNPAIYYQRGDSFVGRDYEILSSISQQHGIPMRFHPYVPIKHAMEYLDYGLYDVVVSSIPITPEIKEKYLITEPVRLDREVLVQLRDSSGSGAVTSQLQLGGDTIWVSNRGSQARIENLSMEIGDTIHINHDDAYSAEHLIMLVATGVIKYAVVDEATAQSLNDDYPQIDISTPISFTQFRSWILNPKHRQLADSLNAWINPMQ